jgi:molecular chaperone HtpG
MEKVLNSMPGAKENAVKAKLVLEINAQHPISEKLKTLFSDDKDTFTKYTKLLYDEACLISGKGLDNALEHSNLVCELMK